MKLNSLRLANFRQHVSTEINFGQGITGIIGPNGAGKTTILEAIGFALYAWGRSGRDQMESLSGRGRMKVELDFELGRHRYRVERSRTSAFLFLDDGEAPIASSSIAVTAKVQQLLGMSREEFFRTYFTGQKDLSLMASMGPAERGRFLSKVLGYEKLRLAQELITERRRQLSSEIHGLRTAMPDPEIVERSLAEARERMQRATEAARSAAHRHSIASGKLSVITPRWEQAQQNRSKSQTLETEIAAREREEASAARNVERVSAELERIAAAGAELARLRRSLEPLGELRDEISILDEMYREEGRRKTLMESDQALREELDRLRARHTVIERAPVLEEEATLKLEAKRAELEDTQGALEAKRTEWVRDRQDVETKHKNLRRQLEEVQQQRKQVMELGADGACPTCSRKLGENLQNVVDHLTETAETLSVDVEYFKQRLEQLSDMPVPIRKLDEARRGLTGEVAGLERRLTRVQLAVQELSGLTRDIAAKERRAEQLRRDISAIAQGFDSARFDFVKSEIARLAPLEQEATRLSALLEGEQVLRDQLREYSASLDATKALLGTLRTRYRQMSWAAADFENLRAQYERCVAEARAAEVETSGSAASLAGASEALDAAVKASEESVAMRATVAQREDQRRLHEELDRAFNEMRAQLNAQLRPELSELATTFLRDLMDSRTAELELDDKYAITVLEDGIPKPVLSGGEEDLANLVLRLAVSQMIAERSGQAFSLLVLDEVFGSLDELRRFNVLELLRALGDRFEQVILITHIESVRDGLDQVISVRYDPGAGTSVVEQSEGEGSAASGAPGEGLELEPAAAG